MVPADTPPYYVLRKGQYNRNHLLKLFRLKAKVLDLNHLEIIASRIMNGQSLAFNHLSGGAREQFSLIHRAACSLAVSKDGGAPLILDDALGYSDAERLIGMNEVLSRAAQKCQIIILTCMPSRYGYIEPALRINMEEILAN